MGLLRAGVLDNLESRFSDNVLKVELSGPEHHHLSVVDVSGLFHRWSHWEAYRIAADRVQIPEIIRKLIMDYFSDPRIIILYDLLSDNVARINV